MNSFLKDLLYQAITVLSFGMLFLALATVTSVTLRQMVRYYRWQAAMLVGIVVVASFFESGLNAVTLASVGLLPLLLIILIKPLLQRATVKQEPMSLRATLHEIGGQLRMTLFSLAVVTPVDVIWLQHGRSRLSQQGSIAVSLALIVAAFVVPYQFIDFGTVAGGPEARARALASTDSLAVALALLLLGLFTMINKRDIIAQIIGLLVMEHGMFLAAVTVPALAATKTPGYVVTFVIALFFYTVITLTILMWLLPTLHSTSESIDLDAQQHLQG